MESGINVFQGVQQGTAHACICADKSLCITLEPCVFVPLDQRSRNEQPWKVRNKIGLPFELRMVRLAFKMHHLGILLQAILIVVKANQIDHVTTVSRVTFFLDPRQ